MMLRSFSLNYIIRMLLLLCIPVFSACEEEHDEINYDNPFSENNPVTHGDPYELRYEVTNEGILLQWDDISGFDGFFVYRKTRQDENFKQIDESYSGTYTDHPPAGLTYIYRISAYRGFPVSIEAPPSGAVEVQYRLELNIEEVFISKGDFQMGSDDDEEDDNPEHTVYLDDFYIDAFEVTNAQYRKFVDAKKYAEPIYWDDPELNQPDQPVVGMSWEDAKAYCEWVGRRLPTEVEWERAARDGLGGKIWEWCADWYDEFYYRNSVWQNPKGPVSGQERVARGGSCHDIQSIRNLCITRRGKYSPDSKADFLGFRCARSK